jgi:GH3 auxin-responsive promoter
MSLLGTVIQKGAQLGALAGENPLAPAEQQRIQLCQLLKKAKNTTFGRHYGFRDLLHAPDVERAFRRAVPAMDYNTLYERWWSQAHQCDSPDVCWPGIVPYYALSSGTSQAASKYIPITDDMLRAMKRGSRSLFCDMAGFGLPARQFTKQMLMVGSCTRPKREGRHYSGDLSGIIGLHRPLWMEHYYRPGRHITDLPEWNQRIEKMVEEAPGWDIGFAVSNPMWLQIILERILERYRLQNIHQLWPNFSMYVHGSVFFEPYRASFENMLGRPIDFVDSYMASEGFFAYQTQPGGRSMRFMTDNSIYFEFVPFTADYFDENGDLKTEFPRSLSLDEVETGVHYALLLNTCAGAWRYLLGDTVQFTDTTNGSFKLTGRTKQFLSVCGEHLSIDNLGEAVRRADLRLRAGVREFCVGGFRDGIFWGHQWYVSCDNRDVCKAQLLKLIDEELCKLNDDYAVERIYALRTLRMEILPQEVFFAWLEQRGKLNGQAKIPRVLKDTQLYDFETLTQTLNPKP